MTVTFSNITNSLCTRSLALEIRKEILAYLRKGESVVFDLTEVEVITHSFADECFAKLLLEIELPQLKKITSFKGTTPLVNKIIQDSFKERIEKMLCA